MANNGTMIYGQVAITDVMAVLGISTTDVISACNNLHGKIKKWARWKPVVWAYQFNPRTDMWRGSDGRCGLSIKTYGGVGSSTVPGNFLYDIMHNLCGWVYNAPQGGESQPLRLGDFSHWLSTNTAGNLGYINYAEPPYTVADIELYPSNDGTVDFPFDEGDVDDSGNSMIAPEFRDPTKLDPNLDLLDFAFDGVWAGEFYFGLVLSNGLVFTGDKKLKDGGMGQVTARNINLSSGTYTAWPFLSSYSRPYGANEQVGTLIPIDNWSFKVKIKSSSDNGVIIWAYVSVDKYGKVVEAAVMITNNLTSPVTASKAHVAIQYGKKMFDGSTCLTISCGNNSVTVPAGETGEIPISGLGGSIPNYDPLNYQYWCRGYVDGGNLGNRITFQDTPLEEADDEGGGSDMAE